MLSFVKTSNFVLQVVFTTNNSPSESLMTHSVYVGIPNNCSGHRMATRIANSMPPKKWSYSEVIMPFYTLSLLTNYFVA